MIKLIALDLDDTLLDEYSRLPERNIQAVQQAFSRGAVVTVATGRMTSAALSFAKKLGVSAPLILYNGALVWNPETDETLYERPIPLELTREILRTAEERGRYIQFFDHSDYYYAHHGSYSRLYGESIGVAGKETGEPLSGWVQKPAMKLLMVTRDTDRDAVCAEFRQLFGEQVNIMPTRRNYIEFVAKDVDKGAALEAMANALNIPQECVAAFGDAQNDIGMLRWAGTGYCMRNGCAEAKAAADRIAPPNTAFGVAQEIEKMIAEGRL